MLPCRWPQTVWGKHDISVVQTMCLQDLLCTSMYLQLCTGATPPEFHRQDVSEQHIT